MASQYKVTQVHGSNPWTSDYGEMLSWSLQVDNLTEGTNGYVEINSKPNNAYTVGKEFWAEVKGERNGVLKLKTVQAPKPGFGGSQASPPAQRPSPAPQAAPSAPQAVQLAPVVAKPKPMAWTEAEKLFTHLSVTFASTEAAATFIRLILDGKVENPLVAPKTTVVYFGNELETAGIEQAAWDEIDGLCSDLSELSDQKHVKALLIATCMVQSRKDLTADKAKLFAAALRANIQVAKDQRAKNEPPDMSDVPF